MPGRHLLTWAASDGSSHVDMVDVWSADPHYGISLADAADAVGNAPTASADVMPLYVAAATYVIEDLAGPVVPEARTWATDGGSRRIALPAMGVQVSQVTVDGVVVDPAGYKVDEAAGIVVAASPFADGDLNVEIAYRVGGGPLPANLRLAIREQVRFLWQVAKAGNGRAAQDLGYTPAGYAVPYLVLGLCQAAPRAGGFS